MSGMYCGGHGESLPCKTCAENLAKRLEREAAMNSKVVGYLWPSGRMSADVPAGSNPIDVAIAAKCKPMMLATPCALAADDLLEALQALLAHYEKPAGFDKAMLLTDDEFGEFLQGISAKSNEAAYRARAAIAKATGEQA